SGSTARSNRAGSGCCTRSRVCRRPCPTTSWIASPTCRRSCGRASRIWSRWRPSGTQAHAPSRKACRVWPRRRSSNGTYEVCGHEGEAEVAELQPGSLEVEVEQIKLKGADGTAVDAVHARPDGMPISGIVLHPDLMGLRPLFDDLCRRLATHGFAVCAPEPFVRAPEHVRSAEVPSARQEYVKELDDAVQLYALQPPADYLGVREDVLEIAVMGFCMGGMQALKAAATGRFDKAVVFYGMIRPPEGWRAAKQRLPLDTASDVCPTLA